MENSKIKESLSRFTIFSVSTSTASTRSLLLFTTPVCIAVWSEGQGRLVCAVFSLISSKIPRCHIFHNLHEIVRPVGEDRDHRSLVYVVLRVHSKFISIIFCRWKIQRAAFSLSLTPCSLTCNFFWWCHIVAFSYPRYHKSTYFSSSNSWCLPYFADGESRFSAGRGCGGSVGKLPLAGDGTAAAEKGIIWESLVLSESGKNE